MQVYKDARKVVRDSLLNLVGQHNMHTHEIDTNSYPYEELTDGGKREAIAIQEGCIRILQKLLRSEDLS